MAACHALLEYAGNVDGGSKQNDIQEALFKAFFTDGSTLETEDVVKIGVDAGLDAETVKKVITDENNLKKVFTKAKQWSQIGVTGVPYFFMNGHGAFSGAQDADTFVKVFDKIAQRQPQALPVGEGDGKL